MYNLRKFYRNMIIQISWWNFWKTIGSKVCLKCTNIFLYCNWLKCSSLVFFYSTIQKEKIRFWNSFILQCSVNNILLKFQKIWLPFRGLSFVDKKEISQFKFQCLCGHFLRKNNRIVTQTHTHTLTHMYTE